jgi:hypothetical protein
MITTAKAEGEAMKVFQQTHYTTLCGAPDEWEQLKDRFKAFDTVSIIDLRTANEQSDFEMGNLPEGWKRQWMPLRGNTVSEQDLDVFRREQRRHGRLIALATSETRGSLLALTDISRINRTTLPKDELSQLSDLKGEQELIDWLNAYLTRHQTTDQVGVY